MRAPVALFRADLEGRLRFANHAMARLLGVDTPAALLDRSLTEDFGYPGARRETPEMPGHDVRETLLSWQRVGGSSMLLRETMWPWRDSTGEIQGFEGIVEDVSTPDAQPDAPPAQWEPLASAEPEEDSTWIHHPEIAVAEEPPAQVEADEWQPTWQLLEELPTPSIDADLRHIASASGAGAGDGAPAEAPSPTPTPNGAPASQPPADAAEAPARPRILVLEDNTEARHLFERLLKTRYDVDAVGDARAALERMSKCRYDLLLIDIHLGGKETGADVLGVARTLPGYQNVAAIAVTAYALPGDRAAFLEAGFTDYVAKPFTVRALLEAIDLQLAGLPKT